MYEGMPFSRICRLEASPAVCVRFNPCFFAPLPVPPALERTCSVTTDVSATAMFGDKSAALDALADQYSKTHSWLFGPQDRQSMVQLHRLHKPLGKPIHFGERQLAPPQMESHQQSEQNDMPVDTDPAIPSGGDDSCGATSSKAVFPRFVYCICTLDGSILIYDTQFLCRPLAVLHRLHLAPMTDASWSTDGHLLVCSSSDGYITIVLFTEAELGKMLDTPKVINSPRSATQGPEQQATDATLVRHDLGLHQQESVAEAPLVKATGIPKPRLLVLGNARAKVLQNLETNTGPTSGMADPSLNANT